MKKVIAVFNMTWDGFCDLVQGSALRILFTFSAKNPPLCKTEQTFSPTALSEITEWIKQRTE